jgi:N-acetylmuramic acid 6-phosphate etherase
MHVANSKLRDRATRICQTATGCDDDAARRALAEAGDDIAVAIVMLARGADAGAATAALEAAGGNLRRALQT